MLKAHIKPRTLPLPDSMAKFKFMVQTKIAINGGLPYVNFKRLQNSRFLTSVKSFFYCYMTEANLFSYLSEAHPALSEGKYLLVCFVGS